MGQRLSLRAVVRLTCPPSQSQYISEYASELGQVIWKDVQISRVRQGREFDCLRSITPHPNFIPISTTSVSSPSTYALCRIYSIHQSTRNHGKHELYFQTFLVVVSRSNSFWRREWSKQMNIRYFYHGRC